MIRGGKLNQSLQQLAFAAFDVMPQRFPRFMRLKVAAAIEESRAFQESRLFSRNRVIELPAR